MSVIAIGILLCAPIFLLMCVMYYVVCRPGFLTVNMEPLIENL
jgi:hypothetical protein